MHVGAWGRRRARRSNDTARRRPCTAPAHHLYQRCRGCDFKALARPAASAVRISARYPAATTPCRRRAVSRWSPAAPVRRGRLYARGAADDKGQLFIHLAVLEAWQRAGGGCPVNVKLLLEGEEEIGSPHLPPLLRARARELACDVVVVSDTHMLGPRTPSITAGLRGICCCEIVVSSRTQVEGRRGPRRSRRALHADGRAV
ncbi:MAG: M20/M25/M40 family metallo-hydrolase [Proteobacteria bacterium]|nr:M20/M25/M40 family metallo-hydrolase [Pseudomonadota bacterium]